LKFKSSNDSLLDTPVSVTTEPTWNVNYTTFVNLAPDTNMQSIITSGGFYGKKRFTTESTDSLSIYSSGGIKVTKNVSCGGHALADTVMANEVYYRSAPTIYADSAAAYTGGVRPGSFYLITGGVAKVMY